MSILGRRPSFSSCLDLTFQITQILNWYKPQGSFNNRLKIPPRDLYLKKIFKKNRKENNAWPFLWSSSLFFCFLLPIEWLSYQPFVLFTFASLITTLSYLPGRCSTISFTNYICKIFFWLLVINPRAIFKTESLFEIMTKVTWSVIILVFLREGLLSWYSPTATLFLCV